MFQVEERLRFYDTGDAPRKNIAVMEKVASDIANDAKKIAVSTPTSKKKRERRDEGNTTPAATADVDSAKSSKKKKKLKKKK